MEATGASGRQRYVILPASSSWNPSAEGLSQHLVDAASAAALQPPGAHPAVLELKEIGLPDATSELLSQLGTLRPPGRRAPRLKVLDTVAPNDTTLIEVSEADRQAMLARYPGVRIVPEVGNDPAWQQGLLQALSLDAVGGEPAEGSSVSLEVQVLDDSTGRPLRGVTVAAIVDRRQQTGVKGKTDREGLCTLVLPRRSAKLQALVAMPDHSHWPWCLAPHAARAESPRIECRLRAIDLTAPDGRQLFAQPGALDDGRGVKVAVIDGGVDAGHPDLKVSGGGGFALGLDRGDFSDCGNGHGTHVAGVIAGRGEPGTGVRGVSPGVALHAYRVWNKPTDQASSFAISKAIRAAIDDGCDLINLSLGAKVDQPEVMREILRGRTLGAVFIVAAGNDQRRRVRYPAAYPSVIAVTALGIKGSYPDDASQRLEELEPFGRIAPHDVYFAGFSNFGSEVDVIAPGVGIVSTYPGGRYAVMDGTSFACPMATGVIARELARNPELLGADRDQNRSDLIVAMALTIAERCKIGFGPLYEGSGALR